MKNERASEYVFRFRIRHIPGICSLASVLNSGTSDEQKFENLEYIQYAGETYDFDFLYRIGNKTIRVVVYKNGHFRESRGMLRRIAKETLQEDGII